MTKHRFYLLVIAVLLALNGILIGKIAFWNRPVHREPREIIIEQLDLNEQQVSDYDKLIRAHRSAIRQKDRELREWKDSLYQQLRNPDTDPGPDSLIARINSIQREIEYIHYHHFQDIRTLCRADQLIHFNELVHELGELFSSKKPPRK